MSKIIKVGRSIFKNTLIDALNMADADSEIHVDPGEYNIDDIYGFYPYQKLKIIGKGKSASDVVIRISFLGNEKTVLVLNNVTILGSNKKIGISNSVKEYHMCISMCDSQLILDKCMIKNNFDINMNEIFPLQEDDREVYSLHLGNMKQIYINQSEIYGLCSFYDNKNFNINYSMIDGIELNANTLLTVSTKFNFIYCNKNKIEGKKIFLGSIPQKRVMLLNNNSDIYLDSIEFLDSNNEIYIEKGSKLKIKDSNLDSNTNKLYCYGSSDKKDIVVENIIFPNDKDNQKESKTSNNNTYDEKSIDKLNDLVGLQQIKHDIKSFMSMAIFNKKRQEKGMEKIDQTFHSLFVGNPGTGKTVVARLVAKIMYEEGILKTDKYIEADRSTLVGAYVGQTEKKTSKILKDALGGVLFIDEAYTLAGKEDDFGARALDTILKFMEDHRDDIMIIFAGYPKEISKLLKMNSGLESRFPHIFNFEDYSSNEISEIGTIMLEKEGFKFNHYLYKTLVEKEYNESGCNSNARWIRNKNEKLTRIVAMRMIETDNAEIDLILDEDIKKLFES